MSYKRLFSGIIYIFFCLLLIFVLCGCDLSKRTNIYGDHETCDYLMKRLTNYLTNDDFDNAKKLFAPRLYLDDDFDNNLNSLIDYYDGETKDIRGLVDTSDYSNYDYAKKEHLLEYRIETTTDIYRFSINYVEKDTRTKKNVGITCLYVLKLSEDEYPNKRYAGALHATDGIHVAYPHELPEDYFE